MTSRYLIWKCTGKLLLSKFFICFLFIFVFSPIFCRINSLIYNSLVGLEDKDQSSTATLDRPNLVIAKTEWRAENMSRKSEDTSRRSESTPRKAQIVKDKNREKPDNALTSLSASPIVFPLTLYGDYILNSQQICQDVTKLTTLVMVHTAPKHFVRRLHIRSTYGSQQIFGDNVRVVFLLGLVNDDQLQRNITEELRKYGDIVQGNFIDSYHNLTHKGVMGFRWITEHCSHVKYVVKVDDDAVFDMWRFLKLLGHRDGYKSILCHAVYSGRIFRKGKWKMEEGFMNGTKRWPWTYCPGFVVILTGDVIKPLFQAAHTTPFLWIDDVYLYGYLPYQANRTRIYQMPRMMQVDAYDKGVNCLLKKGAKCEYIAVGGTENTFMRYWTLMKQRNGIKI